jgi:hypothetical protein
MGYGLDGWGSFPSRRKIFLFSMASRPAQGNNQSPFQWVLGREADHTPPSSAEVMNGGDIYTSTPPYVFMS